MRRKTLAVLLAVLWIVLSGVDLVEDFDLASYGKVQNAKTTTFPSLGQGIKIANDNFENATRTVISQIGPLRPPNLPGVTCQPHNKASQVPRKHLQLYKLHSAFLI